MDAGRPQVVTRYFYYKAKISSASPVFFFILPFPGQRREGKSRTTQQEFYWEWCVLKYIN